MDVTATKKCRDALQIRVNVVKSHSPLFNKKESPYKDWTLWKKGRDAWDIDLVDFDSISKITK